MSFEPSNLVEPPKARLLPSRVAHRRFARPISPLSLVSTDEQAEEVPFPRQSAPTAEATEEGITPQTSFSSSTTIDFSQFGLGQKEVGNDGGKKRLHPPTPFRRRFWVTILVFLLSVATALEVALHFSEVEQGWALPPVLTDATGVWHFVVTSPPIIISMVLSSAWAWTRTEVQKLQPLLNLSNHHGRGELPSKTLYLDYTDQNVFFALYSSIKYRDWLVALACGLSLITVVFQPLSAALFTSRDVWWLFPATNVTRLASVGLNSQQNWQDMTAFQGASGFATADMLYNIGLPPFVDTNGYTVEAFELPDVTNGTVYANVTAVHYQASCEHPTDFTMEQPMNTSIFENTAYFNGCSYSWTVDNTSSSLAGVDTLQDNSGCQNFTNIPLQFRPVVFWFFIYEPIQLLSAVLCHPGLSVSSVSVAVDVASKETSVLSGTDVTSNIVTQQSVYNGLFFDIDDTDAMAVLRMEGIQQQLPSAIFQAAKTADPTLSNTFIYYGFTNITSSIYNTYLSLVAKSLYFVEVEDTLSVRVGAWCKREFLVPATVHVLSICAVLLAVLGIVLQLSHRRERRDLAIPPHFTTLWCALHIDVDPHVRWAFEHVPCAEDADKGGTRLTLHQGDRWRLSTVRENDRPATPALTEESEPAEVTGESVLVAARRGRWVADATRRLSMLLQARRWSQPEDSSPDSESDFGIELGGSR